MDCGLMSADHGLGCCLSRAPLRPAASVRAPEKVTAPALLPGAVALHGLYGVSVCGGEAGCDVGSGVAPYRGIGVVSGPRRPS